MEREYLKKVAFKYVHEYYKETNYMFANDLNTFIGWFNYTLRNMKMLVATKLDNKYFEFTYNFSKDEIYVDVYENIKNEVIDHE